MVTKLAIAISGAVSLGSYEAGVMYEVIRAIADNNQKAKDNPSIDRIEIDIITGASAGGMTASLLAQHLLCHDTTLDNPYDNPLFNAWVRDVDVLNSQDKPGLLQVKGDDYSKSLLNFGAVKAIGEKYLLDNPTLSAHQHPAASSRIHLGVAMSNLDGFDYLIPFDDNQKFGYRRHRDHFICEVNRVNPSIVTLTEKTYFLDDNRKLVLNPTNIDAGQDDVTWSTVRQMGLSSGAFPIAFPVQAIERIGAGAFETRDSRIRPGSYRYSDGGIFENEPIGMAKRIADQIDSPGDTRLYLYVAPGTLNPSKIDQSGQEDDLLTTTLSVVSAIFGQARFQEWIEAGITPPFSITATDSQLIGEVFSAFAGFLELKFRLYDYNIGRELAQEKLRNGELLGLLPLSNLYLPESLQWRDAVNTNEEQAELVIGNMLIEEWPNAKAMLSLLAAEYQYNQKRNQGIELQGLMHEVATKTRKEIKCQLLKRSDTLVEYVNQQYLEKLDKKTDGSIKSRYFSFLKLRLRQRIGKPLTQWFLRLILNHFLQQYVVHPPKVFNRIRQTVFSLPSSKFKIERAQELLYLGLEARNRFNTFWKTQDESQGLGILPINYNNINKEYRFIRNLIFTQVVLFAFKKRQLFGFIAERDNEFFVIFRGSQTIPDWISNGRLFQFNNNQITKHLPGIKGEIHRGFFDQYTRPDGNLPSISQQIQVVLNSDIVKGRPIYVSGHSLGGALATLAAAELRQLNPNSPIYLYTSASPRVGDPDFARSCSDIQTYRIYNTADLVPKLPPKFDSQNGSAQYVHFDEAVDANGNRIHPCEPLSFEMNYWSLKKWDFLELNHTLPAYAEALRLDSHVFEYQKR